MSPTKDQPLRGYRQDLANQNECVVVTSLVKLSTAYLGERVGWPGTTRSVGNKILQHQDMKDAGMIEMLYSSENARQVRTKGVMAIKPNSILCSERQRWRRDGRKRHAATECVSVMHNKRSDGSVSEKDNRTGHAVVCFGETRTVHRSNAEGTCRV